MGRNGSGKSSLMKIIFGTLRGEHQSVRFNGKYTEQLFTIPNAVHYLPQDGFAMNYLSFEDLTKIFELNRHLDSILKIEEITRNRKEKLGTLSGGIKKLMEIIVSLYSRASFVLLDEPFSFLSPVLVEKIIPHIITQSQHKGIILADHQYQTVLSVCNKYYVLTSGCLTPIQDESELERYGYLAPQKTGESFL